MCHILLILEGLGRYVIYLCCIPWWGKKEEQHFFKRIYMSFYWSWSFYGLWDRRTQVRLPYRPIISLEHSTQCYLKDPLSTSSACRSGLLNWRPGMSHRPQWAHSQWLQACFDSGLHCLQLLTGGCSIGGSGPQWGALTDCKLALSLAFTVPNWLICRGHLHILFHTPHFWLDHMIFFCLFTQVHLWLTAWSRINM